MSKVFPIIAGTSDIPLQDNLLFGNLKHLIDSSITKAKLDYYDGSRPADLNKQIREDLGPYIVPSTRILPLEGWMAYIRGSGIYRAMPWCATPLRAPIEVTEDVIGR